MTLHLVRLEPIDNTVGKQVRKDVFFDFIFLDVSFSRLVQENPGIILCQITPTKCGKNPTEFFGKIVQ